MAIDSKEIDRVVDDFETKASEIHEIIDKLPAEQQAFYKGKVQGLEYTAKVVRTVMV